MALNSQNILRDAPFSHLDLVSCRNLLIYLQPRAQRAVLRTLHYALEPAGHLLLGTSETVGDAPELFSSVDRKNKIYRKKLVAPEVPLHLGFEAPGRLEPSREPSATRPTLSLQGLADRKVLELHGPPGVVVSEDFDILLFRGHTGPYLDPAPGAASLNVLKVARFELHIELKRALQQARSEQLRVTTDITYQENEERCRVEIDVVPLHDLDSRTPCFLVLFRRMPSPDELPVLSTEQAKTENPAFLFVQRNQELERELAMTKEYLQATVEEKESTLEELKSANEEMQSSNEELQSMNEELETSKEELQSTNEELTTVNEELYNRMTELSQANDDLHNVLAGVDNAVIIVGMDLRIRRYTRAAEELLNLIPGDVGRSIGYLDTFLGVDVLEPKVSTVIHRLSTVEEEVLASNQRWYTLRVSPYKTLDHTIRGALVALVDIDVHKRATDMTRDVGAYAARFLGAISNPLLILDRTLRVVWANDALLSALQLSPEETVGSLLPSLGTGQFADRGLRERLEGVFASASILRRYEMGLQAWGEREHAAWVGASLIPASTEVPLALLSIEPVQAFSGGAP